MLTEEQKNAIQAAYSRFIEACGFQPRNCQKSMIAEVARSLAGVAALRGEGGIPAVVVEAGTGTGKTVAYLVPALLLAKSLGRKLIVSTATIALQEQLMHQDLPSLKEQGGLDFHSAFAKGRRRYVCLARLEGLLHDQAQLELPGDAGEAGARERQLYRELHRSLGEGDWNGDLDEWRDALSGATRERLTTDHSQCLGRRCDSFSSCAFYRARDGLHGADLIVANHDLVLADLAAGNSVLPDPAEAFFIFDEAHHLPVKATGHLQHQLPLGGTRDWLAGLADVVVQSLAGASRDRLAEVQALTLRVEQAAERAGVLLESFSGLLQAILPEAAEQLRLKQGDLDGGAGREAMRDLALAQQQLGKQLAGDLQRACGLLESELERAEGAVREALEGFCMNLRGQLEHAARAEGLWAAYARPDTEEVPPLARWARRDERQDDLVLHASPITVADELRQLIWDRCGGAVLTSATLSVGGDFTRFCEQVGLPEAVPCIRLESPFRFAEQAELNIPDMRHDPRNQEGHCREMAALLPELVSAGTGTLVLFNSRQQLDLVRSRLPKDFRENLLCQDELGKQELLRRHRARVDEGGTSVIFGVASFAEGMDLPGDYCTHVIINRLPFSAPDDPVLETLSDWVRSRNRNAFNEIVLPEVTLRLVQATGRLLRTEEDRGRITILDRRLATEHYGRRMLEALPPYRREPDGGTAGRFGERGDLA